MIGRVQRQAGESAGKGSGARAVRGAAVRDCRIGRSAIADTARRHCRAALVGHRAAAGNGGGGRTDGRSGDHLRRNDDGGEALRGAGGDGRNPVIPRRKGVAGERRSNRPAPSRGNGEGIIPVVIGHGRARLITRCVRLVSDRHAGQRQSVCRDRSNDDRAAAYRQRCRCSISGQAGPGGDRAGCERVGAGGGSGHREADGALAAGSNHRAGQSDRAVRARGQGSAAGCRGSRRGLQAAGKQRLKADAGKRVAAVGIGDGEVQRSGGIDADHSRAERGGNRRGHGRPIFLGAGDDKDAARGVALRQQALVEHKSVVVRFVYHDRTRIVVRGHSSGNGVGGAVDHRYAVADASVVAVGNIDFVAHRVDGDGLCPAAGLAHGDVGQNRLRGAVDHRDRSGLGPAAPHRREVGGIDAIGHGVHGDRGGVDAGDAADGMGCAVNHRQCRARSVGVELVGDWIEGQQRSLGGQSCNKRSLQRAPADHRDLPNVVVQNIGEVARGVHGHGRGTEQIGCARPMNCRVRVARVAIHDSDIRSVIGQVCLVRCGVDGNIVVVLVEFGGEVPGPCRLIDGEKPAVRPAIDRARGGVESHLVGALLAAQRQAVIGQRVGIDLGKIPAADGKYLMESGVDGGELSAPAEGESLLRNDGKHASRKHTDARQRHVEIAGNSVAANVQIALSRAVQPGQEGILDGAALPRG